MSKNILVILQLFFCASLYGYPWWGAEDIEAVDSVCASVEQLYPLELLDTTGWRDSCQAARVKARWSSTYTGYHGPTYSPNLDEVVGDLLAVLGDPAARLLRYAPPDEPPDTSRVPPDLPLTEIGPQVYFGDLGRNLGYLCIESWQGGDSVVAAVDAALEELRFTNGLVLDLRAWAGGSVEQGYRVLARFTDQRLSGVHIRKRLGGTPHATDSCYVVEPHGEWRYTKPVVMLVEGAWPAHAIAQASEPLRHVRVIRPTITQLPRGVEPVVVKISREFTIQIPTATLVQGDGTVVPGPRIQPALTFTPRCGDREDDMLWDAVELLQELVLQERYQQQERMEELFRR